MLGFFYYFVIFSVVKVNFLLLNSFWLVSFSVGIIGRERNVIWINGLLGNGLYLWAAVFKVLICFVSDCVVLVFISLVMGNGRWFCIWLLCIMYSLLLFWIIWLIVSVIFLVLWLIIIILWLLWLIVAVSVFLFSLKLLSKL